MHRKCSQSELVWKTISPTCIHVNIKTYSSPWSRIVMALGPLQSCHAQSTVATPLIAKPTPRFVIASFTAWWSQQSLGSYGIHLPYSATCLQKSSWQTMNPAPLSRLGSQLEFDTTSQTSWKLASMATYRVYFHLTKLVSHSSYTRKEETLTDLQYLVPSPCQDWYQARGRLGILQPMCQQEYIAPQACCLSNLVVIYQAYVWAAWYDTILGPCA